MFCQHVARFCRVRPNSYEFNSVGLPLLQGGPPRAITPSQGHPGSKCFSSVHAHAVHWQDEVRCLAVRFVSPDLRRVLLKRSCSQHLNDTRVAHVPVLRQRVQLEGSFDVSEVGVRPSRSSCPPGPGRSPSCCRFRGSSPSSQHDAGAPLRTSSAPAPCFPHHNAWQILGR